MKKIFVAAFLLLCICEMCAAQDFDFGNITDEELTLKNYAKDTSAHAVVLREFGKRRIDLLDDKIKVIYEYHVKIKIFDEKGFENGIVKIPLIDNQNAEELDEITALTCYKDDDGLTQKKELTDKKGYPERINKNKVVYKYPLPGLRNGCVVEYKYTVESSNFALNSWYFQWDIPKIYSEYEVHIPAFWVYNVSLRGSLKLTKNSSEIEERCLDLHGIACNCSSLVFGMADIPAFIEEEYMTTPRNFLSAINFELTEETDFFIFRKVRITKEWKDIDYLLKTDDNFQLNHKGLFKDKISSVVADKTDDLSKAKAVYNYIKNNFKWNGTDGFVSPERLTTVLDAHVGNVGGINLSLIAALNAAGLNTSAVLLATRDNGILNKLHPVLTEFNYVVAKVDIGNHQYLLDATDPLLPFGMLPLRCLNDQGRVFSLDRPSYWIDMNLPQKETTTHNFDFTLQDNGKIKGTVTNYYIGYKAYEKRKEIKKFNTTDEYVEDLNAKLPKFKILKANILNLDSLDKPLGEQYEVEISLYDKTGGDRLIFNPFFMDRIVKNPFKLADRSYPVDWGMPSDERFNLIMHLPAQYTVEKSPQITAVALPNNGGRFLSSYEAGDNSFTFSNVIQFTKSIYSSEEYPYLKEIYNKIIQAEQAEMVFKKK